MDAKCTSRSAYGLLRTCGETENITFLATACSVPYESANEPAMQMGIDNLPDEPFTEKQQRQSKMDGGREDDGTTARELVRLQPPVEQEHVAR